jgi:hypothetical protein
VSTETSGEDRVSRYLKAKYGRKAPLSVGFWINTLGRLNKREKRQERIEVELGKDRIVKAYVAWDRLRPKKLGHGGLGDEEIAKIACKHPEVDREVSKWLSKLVKLRQEADNTCLQLGHVVYGAYVCADLCFFKELHCALATYSQNDPATQLKDALHWLASLVSNPMPITLSELVDNLQRLTNRDLDRAYVLRLCKDLGIGLKAGKPGRPAGKRKL